MPPLVHFLRAVVKVLNEVVERTALHRPVRLKAQPAPRLSIVDGKRAHIGMVPAFLRADVWVILACHGRVGHYDELACLPVLVVLHRASPVICNAGKPSGHLQLDAEAEQVGHLRAVAGFHLLPHGYPAFGRKHISHGQRGLHRGHIESCHEPCASVASAVNVQPLQSHGRILPYGHLFLQAGTIIIVGWRTPELRLNRAPVHEHGLAIDVDVVYQAGALAHRKAHHARREADV